METDGQIGAAAPSREVEKLEELLASRASAAHFAHAGIGMVVAVIVLGAAFGAANELERLGGGAELLGAAGAGFVLYSLVRYLRGRVLQRRELECFRRLQALRGTHADEGASLPTGV